MGDRDRRQTSGIIITKWTISIDDDWSKIADCDMKTPDERQFKYTIRVRDDGSHTAEVTLNARFRAIWKGVAGRVEECQSTGFVEHGFGETVRRRVETQQRTAKPPTSEAGSAVETK